MDVPSESRRTAAETPASVENQQCVANPSLLEVATVCRVGRHELDVRVGPGADRVRKDETATVVIASVIPAAGRFV
jgi:hypothetical protein